MHRSGTSAITRGLLTLGVSLGDRLMKPNALFNAKGYWEDEDINALNAEMLLALGTDWKHASLLDASQIDRLVASGFESRAAELLRTKTRANPVFGFKDPRLGKLLRFWKRVFQQDHYALGYLLALRNPLSVAASLEKRDGLDRTHSYLSWLTHTVNCIKESEGCPRVIVDFDRLMQAPREQIARVAQVFGLQVDSEKLAEYADEFLDTTLRHSVYGVEDLRQDRACPSIVAQCYGELLDIAEDKRDIGDPAFLARTREWVEELERIDPLIACVDRFDSESRRPKPPIMAAPFLEICAYLSERLDGNAQPSGEFGTVTQAYAADGQPTAINLIFPADLQALARLRLDVANAPAAITLNGLALHDANGAELWRWDGGCDSFVNPAGVVCLPGDGGATLLCLNDDPQFDLATPPSVLARVGGGASLRLVLTARPLLDELPTVLAHLQARHDAVVPAPGGTRLPAGLSGNPEELAGDLAAELPLTSHETAATRDHYRVWRSMRSPQEIDAQRHAERMMLQWRQKPMFRVVVALDTGQEGLLADVLDALSRQLYPHWQLVVVAPFAAPDPAFDEIPGLFWVQWTPAEEVSAKARIKTADARPQDPGGLAEVMNAILGELGEDWVWFLPPGAQPDPFAFLKFGDYIDLKPEWRAIYCDDDTLTGTREYGNPRFKPDFNLDYLRSMDYVGPSLFRADAVLAAGGYSRFDGASSYDLLLRFFDTFGEESIGHISDVLLHLPPQGANDSTDIREALTEHLARRGIRAEVKAGFLPGTCRVVYQWDENPPVSIIIPNKDKLEFLEPCVESLLAKTSYPDYELIIVDNQSSDPDLLAYYSALQRNAQKRVRILSHDAPFNFSAMMNLAVREAQGDYLLLLNNDTQIVQDEWLSRMMHHGMRPEVGAVGARLVYPETGKIQHAGVIVGLSGIADHPFDRQLALDEPGYMNRAQVDQNYSAVTAACMLVRKSVWEQVGGMDEERLKVLFNDVDLCLKIGQAGYRIVWTPHATVIHHGSTSLKGDAVNLMKLAVSAERAEQECAAMVERWMPLLANDPAYNRHLSLRPPGYRVESGAVIDWDPNFRDRPLILGAPLPDGAGEYRVLGPFRALGRAGLAQCDVMRPDHMNKYRLLPPVELERTGCDTLVHHAAISDVYLEYLTNYRRFNPEVLQVFQLDDLLTQLPTANPLRRYVPRDAKPRLRKALALCDRAIVSTEPLAELCRSMIGDVRVIPNRLEAAKWARLTSNRRTGPKPRVGWVGAQQHGGDLALIEEAVRATAHEVDWVFFGMCPDALRPYVREFHDFVSPFQKYPAKLASLDLDLAVAPLEINPFNEAKSNLRLLEYGILGWPVVCSDIYPYRVGAPPVCRVPNQPQAWIEAILERAHDPDAAEREGNALRGWVRQHYLLEDHLQEWLGALTRSGMKQTSFPA